MPRILGEEKTEILYLRLDSLGEGAVTLRIVDSKGNSRGDVLHINPQGSLELCSIDPDVAKKAGINIMNPFRSRIYVHRLTN